MKRLSHIRLKKVFVVFVSSVVIMTVSACESTDKHDDVFTPVAEIAVLADLHYFDPDLLVNDGSAFQQYLQADRKLLKEGPYILDSAIAGILQENVDIVLVAGDLTKDGELTSNIGVATYLQELKAAGKKVYVVPGNHDINNPHAVSFDGDTMTPVDYTTPEQFKAIYNDFGYSEAIARDVNSLSYVVEPVPGLQIIAMDSCKYADTVSNGEPETSGAFSPQTKIWIESQLLKASQEGKIVFGVMHHGILEHYQGQKLLFSEYVVDDNDTLAERFADLGMQIVFTGHYHAHDITKTVTSKGNTLYDIETGSLVTAPCPYRIVQLDESQTLTITSKKIETINYSLPSGTTFQEYASTFLNDGMQGLVYYMLTNGKIGIEGNPVVLSEEEAQLLAPYFATAFAAHYQGDEQPDTATRTFIQQLISDTVPGKQLMGQTLGGLWTDLEPADNILKINLNSGDVIQ